MDFNGNVGKKQRELEDHKVQLTMKQSLTIFVRISLL